MTSKLKTPGRAASLRRPRQSRLDEKQKRQIKYICLSDHLKPKTDARKQARPHGRAARRICPNHNGNIGQPGTHCSRHGVPSAP